MKQKQHTETPLFPTGLSKWLQKPQWTMGLPCWGQRPILVLWGHFVQSLFLSETNQVRFEIRGFFSCSFPLCPKILPLQLSSTTEAKIWATSSRKQTWRRKEASMQISCDYRGHRTTTPSSEEYTNSFCKRFAVSFHVPFSWRRQSPVLLSYTAACMQIQINFLNLSVAAHEYKCSLFHQAGWA